MMLAGVFKSSRIGRIATEPAITKNMEEAAVKVSTLPIVRERFSLSRDPKYWETMMLAPIEIPINSTSSRFKIGLALPTAARALSPTYRPTTILSTVL